MKKYVSILLTAIFCTSLLAGCGGSSKSVQQPAGEAQKQAGEVQEQAAQPEKIEETGAEEVAAQADAVQDRAQAAAETANSGEYLIYVNDAETLAPIPGVRVQFCSDSLCRMGKTDENGVASFDSDPGTYTVHMMKAPDGYVKSDEELTLDKDNRVAAYLLAKEGTEPESVADADNTGSAESDYVLDFPNTGFTFNAPEEFKHLLGEIRINDLGEVGIVPDVVAGYVGYQAKTEAELEEYVKTLGINSADDMTDENIARMQAFYANSPNLAFFRVMGVRGEQDIDEINKTMFNSPILVFDEIGTAGDYKFYYIVLDDASYYEELRNTDYPQDRLEEAYKLWQEAATTSNFKDRITVKEPSSPFASLEEGKPVSFETLDMDGNPVTSKELLAGHKITMINIWATWCSNCIKEMEELEALSKEWAEKDCQIIGICEDAEDDEMVTLAQRILKEPGVTYPNVRMTDEIHEQFPTVGMPTTYFVDSEGNILSDPITGRYVEEYVETFEKLLSEME